MFPPFTFIILIIQCCQWCWIRFYKNRQANQNNSQEPPQYFSKFGLSTLEINEFICCSEMIPMNDSIDRAWAEFERYSTNDYIRQLLDAQLAALTKGITTDIM